METIRLCKGCGAVLPAGATGDSCGGCAASAGSAVKGTIVITASQFLPHRAAEETTTVVEPGRRFGGYQLIRSLGQGGMGAVYEAEETESGRRVALKVLSQALDSKDARQRFLREGRLAASVNHPNSVYIFGTEEVEGQPVIAMELVSGGTLQERVRQKGPMPVTEAVGAILDVIAGLEAAAAIGVLHRDVKPSNCFMEADGTVKIGDFGLSKSTVGRAETELTMAESFLGTPAFSSPEQLRGDELTVGSDIYAVGVTFYFILTGHLPFESENMVRVLAMALERPPEPPIKWRPDLPAPINRIVLKCLAKQPGHRFQNYEELRRALTPFSKVAPTPATLSLRVVAGCLDRMVVPLTATAIYLGSVEAGWTKAEAPYDARTGALVLGAVLVCRILYFAVPEHLWGASPAKLICDLRVVDATRSFPSWPKALSRATIFTLVPLIPDAVYAAFITGTEKTLAHPLEFGGNALIVTALMFVAARRSNGFAALHDWATKTRVVERSAYQDARPLVEQGDEPAAAPGLGERVGHYLVLERLRETEGEEWLLGLDEALGRKVWIRRWKGEPPEGVSAARRRLNRPGRLRWLNGRRTTTEKWDAYEAPSGEAFLALVARRQRWREARLWLLDLAQEMEAALRDHSEPEYLSLDRLWITRSGRAKILDFAPPAAVNFAGREEPPLMANDAGTRRFLRQVACSAMEGRALDCDEAHFAGKETTPLPPHGRAFFKELPDFLDLSETVNRLRAMAQQPAAVTRRRRLLTIGGCAAPLAAMVLIVAVVLLLADSLVSKFGDSAKLQRCIGRWMELERQPNDAHRMAEQDALEVCISGFFNKAGTSIDSGPMHIQTTFNPEFAKLAKEIKTRHPAPSPQELSEAEATLSSLLENKKAEIKFDAEKKRELAKQAAGAAVLVSVLSILAAAVCRRGIVLRVTRTQIVTRNGAPARRWRLALRAVLVWGFLFAAGCVAGTVGYGFTAWILGLCFVAGMAASIVTPERTPADRLMGTWLAPE